MEDKKPQLYHASASPILGGYILPQPGKTCEHYAFVGRPEEALHRGNFVFAGANPAIAYAYALKTRHPSELEHSDYGSRPYEFMASCGTVNAADVSGASLHLPLTVITRPKAFLESLSAAQPTIYALPRDNAFEAVRNPQGEAVGEWISQEPVALAQCQAIPVSGIDEAMQRGAQILFLNPLFSKQQWYDVQQAENDRVAASLPPKTPDNHPLLKALMNEATLRFIARKIEDGTLIHANRLCGIRPLDFETGKLQETAPVQQPVAPGQFGKWTEHYLQAGDSKVLQPFYS